MNKILSVSAVLALALSSCSVSLQSQADLANESNFEAFYSFDEAPMGISFYASHIRVHLAQGDSFSVRLAGVESDIQGARVHFDSKKGGGHVSVSRSNFCLNGDENVMNVFVTSPSFHALSFMHSGVTVDNLTPISSDYLKFDCRHRVRTSVHEGNYAPQVSLSGLSCDSLFLLCDSYSSIRMDSVQAAAFIKVESADSASVTLSGVTDSLALFATPATAVDVSHLTVSNHE